MHFPRPVGIRTGAVEKADGAEPDVEDPAEDTPDRIVILKAVGVHVRARKRDYIVDDHREAPSEAAPTYVDIRHKIMDINPKPTSG
jgi:hypothetical protein